MKVKLPGTACFFCLIFFISCAVRNSALFIPVPDFSIYENEKIINKDDIVETKNGGMIQLMPEWLLAFIDGGTEAVEMLDAFGDEYVFMGINEGENFTALNKWAENFSAEQDFAMLAATRIENRMILTATLFPDDEYGAFFETLVKNAYGQVYTGAEKVDVYWVRIRTSNEDGALRNPPPEIYKFFVLFTIKRDTMQTIIKSMMTQARAAVPLRGSQAASVHRLQQNFFTDF